MTTTLEEPLARRTSDESGRLEMLSMAAPEMAGHAVAAFLNGAGGTVVLGAEADRVVGVGGAAEAIRRDLAENLSPQASVSVTVEDWDGRPCVVLDVPPGAAPPYVYRDAIYVRAGGATVRADAGQLSALVQRRFREPTRWERLPALGFELDDLDGEEVARTALEASQRRGGLDRGERAAVLESLGLLDGGQLLNSAVVLFGRQAARRYPQLRVRVAHFADEDQAALFDSQVFEGSAFALLEQAMAFLTRTLPVASVLPVTGLTRRDVPAYPWAAVREGLVNALVHRDYAAYDGSVAITLFPQRLEIWNPGTLPEGWTVGDLRAGHVSRPHNPDIAHVFFLRGLVERLGIGARRIVSSCVAAGLPEPEWTLLGGGVSLTLRLSGKKAARPRLDPPALDWTAPLPARAQAFLRQTPEGRQFTRQEYQRQSAPEVSERTVRNDLARMADQGFLVLVGQGPGTAYVRTGKAVG